jgi:DNA mismatch endonuclease, patch repair protein
VTDIVSKQKRSEMMSGIRSRNTKPEMIVRSWLHRNGYRFRLHRKDIPGGPDIVLPGRRIAIFVHGCFWHRHPGCKLCYTPKSNIERWQRKFDENVERDRRAMAALEEAEWKVIVIWECEVRSGTFPSRFAEGGMLDRIAS